MNPDPPCPTCGQSGGRLCTTPIGRRRPDHVGRVRSNAKEVAMSSAVPTASQLAVALGFNAEQLAAWLNEEPSGKQAELETEAAEEYAARIQAETAEAQGRS